MFNLKIIIASTRPGRKGPSIASWVFEAAQSHKEFDVELIDLAEVNLPFLDEAHHPRLQKYEKQHTKDWSARITAADAFIIVTPEYNFAFPAPLKNALDFLFNEWNYKPAAIVSYGGVAAGTRATQMLKQVLTALKMMPLAESVNIPFFTKHIDEQGKFNPDDTLDKSLKDVFTELGRWTESMQSLRIKK